MHNALIIDTVLIKIDEYLDVENHIAILCSCRYVYYVLSITPWRVFKYMKGPFSLPPREILKGNKFCNLERIPWRQEIDRFRVLHENINFFYYIRSLVNVDNGSMELISLHINPNLLCEIRMSAFNTNSVRILSKFPHGIKKRLRICTDGRIGDLRYIDMIHEQRDDFELTEIIILNTAIFVAQPWFLLSIYGGIKHNLVDKEYREKFCEQVKVLKLDDIPGHDNVKLLSISRFIAKLKQLRKLTVKFSVTDGYKVFWIPSRIKILEVKNIGGFGLLDHILIASEKENGKGLSTLRLSSPKIGDLEGYYLKNLTKLYANFLHCGHGDMMNLFRSLRFSTELQIVEVKISIEQSETAISAIKPISSSNYIRRLIIRYSKSLSLPPSERSDKCTLDYNFFFENSARLKWVLLDFGDFFIPKETSQFTLCHRTARVPSTKHKVCHRDISPTLNLFVSEYLDTSPGYYPCLRPCCTHLKEISQEEKEEINSYLDSGRRRVVYRVSAG